MLTALGTLLRSFFQEEAREPEHAAIDAAGALVTEPNGSMLFLKRSKASDHAGEWALPGGVIEKDEMPDAAALRELEEETGYKADQLEPIKRTANLFASGSPAVNYATYLHRAKDAFEPKLNGEHDEYTWAKPEKPPEPLHPGVRALLDVLVGDDMALDPPVSAKQRRAMWAAAEGHSTLGIPEWVGKEFVGSDGQPLSKCSCDTCIACDEASLRSFNRAGHMRVEPTNISKAVVNDYLGKEIPRIDVRGRILNLDPEKRYRLLRDPKELANAAHTFNKLPLLIRHKPVRASDHPSEIVIGTTGDDASFEAPYLKNSLAIWRQDAIDKIESEAQREISCGYNYVPDMTPGTFNGEPYDGVMRHIEGNHVAIVTEGRAGSDVVVGDAKIRLTTDRSMDMAKTRLGAYVGGRLAGFFRAQPTSKQVMALDSAVGALTAKNFAVEKPKIIAALKGFAQDADLESMHSFIDRLDKKAPGEDAPLIEDPNFSEASGPPPGTEDDLPAKFLKEKLSAEDWSAYDKMVKDKKAKDEASEAEEAKKKEEEARRIKEAGDKKGAKDGDHPEPGGEKEKPLTQDAMNAAVKVAIENERKNAAAIRDAEKDVMPWVGELTMAFDSAEAVYRQALTNLGIKHDGLHRDALPAILHAQRKPGERQQGGERIAMDASATATFDKMFPSAKQIGRA